MFPRLLSVTLATTFGAFSSFTGSAAEQAAAPVTAARDGAQIILRSGSRELLRYQAQPGAFPREEIKEAYRRGGYLHPIYSPAGRRVTDDFPSNHLHHHGIWMAWTQTIFEGRTPDFWNMGDVTGRVDFDSVTEIWEKNGRAGFRSRHSYLDLTAKPPRTALQEEWEIAVTESTAGTPRNIIDFTSKQTCATDAALQLPKYHYGGFGFRGHWDWNGAEALTVLTSEGETDRKKVNESRAKWCWIGGPVDGAAPGVTILCHPSNYRFPQPIRMHPNEPFFCYAPQQLGDMEIAPGKPYISRYRIVVTDQQPSREQADTWWKEWAEGES